MKLIQELTYHNAYFVISFIAAASVVILGLKRKDVILILLAFIVAGIQLLELKPIMDEKKFKVVGEKAMGQWTREKNVK